MLFFFLATPLGVFAQNINVNLGPATQGGYLPPVGGNNFGNAPGGNAGGIDPSMMALMMMGGGLGGGGFGRGGFGGGGFGGGGFGGGGGGPVGMVGQALTMAGMLSGNMGLMMGGMITSMIGGFTGGAGGGYGGTPQQGYVDEQYVAPGQAGPYGAGYGASPYYPTPTPANIPRITPTPTPVASCAKSIFIVKDTTVTPNVTKPYPVTVDIAQNECVLALNSDASLHRVQASLQGQDAIIADQNINSQASHIFRFATKNTYTLCVDTSATACTTVTVR